MRTRPIAVSLILGWLGVGGWCATARGDGGTVRLRERRGPYEIAVFTAPTPFRAGPVDISVLVQDAATGEPVPEARVTVAVSPRGLPGQAVRHTATTEAATNKLLRSAPFELPEPGWWDVAIAFTVGGGRGEDQVRFAVEAAAPAPRWPELWLWLGWPAPTVVLYGLHRYLVWRKSLSKSRTGEGRREGLSRPQGPARAAGREGVFLLHRDSGPLDHASSEDV